MSGNVKQCKGCGAPSSGFGCEYCGVSGKPKDSTTTVELTYVPWGSWESRTKRQIEVCHGAGERDYIKIPVPKDGFNSVTIREFEGNEWVPAHSLNVHIDEKARINIFIHWK